MKVFFNPEMSVDSGGFSPSGSKPGAAVADWLAHDLKVEIHSFEPVSESDLRLAHDPKFLLGVLAGQLANGHGNRNLHVTQSCLWTVGSMVAASRQAILDSVACSPTSGFHHARYDSNGAFCTFNGLIVAAEKLRAEGRVNRVGILDCDAHYGDGTEDIIERLRLQDHILHWTFGAHFGHRKFQQRRLLTELRTALRKMKAFGATLVLYQAGADPHVDDPLGGYMTSAQMRTRDRVVLKECRELQLAVAFNLAGGYNRDSEGTIAPVLALHRATIEEAMILFA
jgi:acetoin utilization deacetylase AcuC-like enzyme